MIRKLRAWQIAVLAVVLLATAATVTVVVQSQRKGLTDSNLAKLEELRIAGTLTPATAEELLGPPCTEFPLSGLPDGTPKRTRMIWDGPFRCQGEVCTLMVTIEFDGDGRCYTCGFGYREIHEDIWTKVGKWLGIWP